MKAHRHWFKGSWIEQDQLQAYATIVWVRLCILITAGQSHV